MQLTEYLRKRLKTRKILLMTHAVVGYPSLEDNWAMLEAMGEADVDVVELQMPFSEPTADGPLFVKANQEALRNGIKLQDYDRPFLQFFQDLISFQKTNQLKLKDYAELKLH